MTGDGKESEVVKSSVIVTHFFFFLLSNIKSYKICYFTISIQKIIKFMSTYYKFIFGKRNMLVLSEQRDT